MVTNEDILDIKSKVGSSWRDLGIRLQFETAELEQMELNFKDDISELIYQLITKWQQKVAGLATKTALAKVFMEIHRGDLADILAMHES